MRISKLFFLTLFLSLALLPSAKAQAADKAAVPYPDATTPKAIDRGELKAQPGVAPISVTVALKMSNLAEAENLLKALHTPGNPQFHQFLTAQEFVARFGPAEADVAKVVAELTKYGLTVERTTATTLKATGSAAAMEKAFAVSLHSFEVPAHGNVAGYTFHSPLTHPTIPSEISGAVSGVVGLDNRPSLHPLNKTVVHALGTAPAAAPASTGDPFEYLTVIDFAKYYHVDPLYERGITGKGRTIGIMTFASSTPSDAIAYWTAIGLDFDPNRITVVNVDGGPGAPSDASGSLETTLDTEQSGGVAPGAKIIIYQAPNTSQGFVDVLATTFDSNKAETVSMSWGEWEWFDNLENSPATDPITGNTVSVLQASHELLVRAALQGQTVDASSGDGGAYEADYSLGGCAGPYSASTPDTCTNPLSVGYPSSDSAITAAGGTTLPGTISICLDAACDSVYTVSHKHERVWGWDYLEGFCVAIGIPDPVACGISDVGSGGGVSISYFEPLYQWGIPGVQLSQPGQVWQATPDIGAYYEIGTYYALPSYFPGRNVPDVSFNSDPETGYIVYYTSSSGTTLGLYQGYGGTSFAAPQLNGVMALIGESVHGRLGLLNYPLYDLVRSGQAYGGDDAPLRAIKYGDNWFYHGSDGYNLGAGVGTMDVANFDAVLRGQH